jgi:hypothetical protein
MHCNRVSRTPSMQQQFIRRRQLCGHVDKHDVEYGRAGAAFA